jgi:hypothetical protein
LGSEVLGAGGTHGGRMPPAVPEEEGTLLGAQITRSFAVDVGDAVADQLDGVAGRDHLDASRTFPFGHSPAPPVGKRPDSAHPGRSSICAKVAELLFTEIRGYEVRAAEIQRT